MKFSKPQRALVPFNLYLDFGDPKSHIESLTALETEAVSIIKARNLQIDVRSSLRLIAREDLLFQPLLAAMLCDLHVRLLAGLSRRSRYALFALDRTVLRIVLLTSLR